MRKIQDSSFSVFHMFIIVMTGLLVTLPAFYNPYIAGHDYIFHIIFSHNFTNQFINGEVYPRWMSDMNAGFGSPTFFFYAPIPYYITSFFSLLLSGDNDGTLALIFSAALALIASGITAYLWLKELVDRRKAIFIAVIYMVLPYHLTVDLYVRFAFAEFWAFVWMPLILLFSIKLKDENACWMIFLAVGISLLIFTHLPTFIIFMPFLLDIFC